jgi:uncharacterized OB-fold protein
MERARSEVDISGLGPDDRPFQAGLFRLPGAPGEKPRLIGQKCRACGLTLYPPKVICPKCWRNDHFEELLLGPYGRLFTFSVVRVGTPQYAQSTPYALGYVDLAEGVRVFAQLAVPDFQELAIGLELELFIDKLYADEENRNVVGYKFRPRRD